MAEGSPTCPTAFPPAAVLRLLDSLELRGAEVHGLLILHRGRTVFEGYSAPHRMEEPHMLHSLTKVLVNTAVGLLYDRGALGLEDRVLDYFPAYRPGANAYLQQLTIRDLLTMRSGQLRRCGGGDWRVLQGSWLKDYFLRVPLQQQPGSRYVYSSGNSYLLSAIVQQITGRTCHDFLQEALFPQLGIGGICWTLSPEGINPGGNGASLTLRQLARIAALYLEGGRAFGRQLLSQRWVDLSLGRLAYPDGFRDEGGYNFHWRRREGCWLAGGMYGQTCAIAPQLGTALVMTAADPADRVEPEVDRFFQDLAAGGASGEAHWQALENRAQRMTLLNRYPVILGENPLHRGQAVYRPAENSAGVRWFSLSVEADAVTCAFWEGDGLHRITAGLNRWREGTSHLGEWGLHDGYPLAGAAVWAHARWLDPHTLELIWRFSGTAYWDMVTLCWGPGRVTLTRRSNTCPHRAVTLVGTPDGAL